MEVIQVNFTPVPCGAFDVAGNCQVLIHINLVKIYKDGAVQTPEKIDFSDYTPFIEPFVRKGIFKKLYLNVVSDTGSKKLDIPVVNPNMSLWNLFNYVAAGALQSIFKDQADIDAEIGAVNTNKRKLKGLIDTLSAAIKLEVQHLAAINTDIRMYEELVTDLGNVIGKLKTELGRIPDNGEYSKALKEYSTKRQDYSDLQQRLTIDAGTRKKNLDAKDEQLKGFNQQYQAAEQAAAVLKDFKESKFIPGDQNNALHFINAHLTPGAQAIVPNSSGATYTSDVEWPKGLYLSDALGYLSSYPAFQAALGLRQEVTVNIKDLPPNGKMTITSDDPAADPIELAYHSVFFETQAFKGRSYLLPKSRTADDRYQLGLLNLGLATFENGQYQQMYDLLQNSYEEAKYRESTASTTGEKMSDYTNGFYLVQNDTSLDINKNAPQGDLYLEDLIQGYRIDVKRNNFTWKSLHQRDYGFTIGVITLPGADEGFISANSVVRAYELVQVTLENDQTPGVTAAELNISLLADKDLTAGKLLYHVSVADPGVHIELLVNSDATGRIGYTSANNTTLYSTLTIKPLSVYSKSSDPLGDFIKDVSGALKAANALLVNRPIDLDNTGRLYYKSVIPPTADKPNPSTPSYLPSSLLCHITGYSLSAKRYIADKLRSYFEKVDESAHGEIETFMQFNKITLQVTAHAGSLPIIRIADTYKVRCRLALIGGAGIGLQEAPDEVCCLEKTYLRQDPIPPPKLLLPSGTAVIAGDTENQLILRQRAEADPAPGKLSTTRLIGPPQITWQLAEWSRMMDDGDKPDAGLMKTTATQKMPVFEPAGVNPKDGVDAVRWKQRTGKFADTVTADTPTPYIVDPMASFFVIEPARMFAWKKEIQDVDFQFADAPTKRLLAAYHKEFDGFRQDFRAHFFTTSGKKTIPKCAFWPKTLAERLSTQDLPLWKLVVKGTEDDNPVSVSVDAGNRTVTILIAFGDDIEFVIRSFTTDPAHVNALYHLMADGDNLDNLTTGSATAGKYLLLGEQRFRAIFARQKPLNPQLGRTRPAGSGIVQQFEPSRDADPKLRTQVIIKQAIEYTGASCNDIYLMGGWDEIIDDVKPDPVKQKAKNFSPIRVIHHFQKVFSYSEPAPYNFAGSNKFDTVPSPMVIMSDDSKDAYRIYANLEGKNLRFLHELGSTKFHAIRYIMAGTSRFAQYFPPGDKDPHLYDSFFTDAFSPAGGDGHYYALEATVKPDAPNIAYMIPLFEVDNTKIVYRGIRVYLNRPWYSSGYGEKFAVVVAITDPTPPADAMKYVTQIGRDITTLGNNIKDSSSYFKTADQVACQLMLPGDSAQAVGVKIIYLPILFDQDQCLWFSDIEFDDVNMEPSYCPFIRLAAVRYQQYAKPGCELSLPVTCDFMQIYPNRSVVRHLDRNSYTINAPLIKKGPHGRLSELYYWLMDDKTCKKDENGGYVVYNADKLSQPQPANYADGQYTIPYGNFRGPILIREFEHYEHAGSDQEKDMSTRRLLYSKILETR